MKLSPEGLQLIKDCEGFRSAPYLCPAGKPTIGFGSTQYANGTQVRLSDPAINISQAGELLAATLTGYEEAVDELVKVPLTQGQFDALTDFTYNCGVGNFKSSTLLKLVNQGDFEHAVQEFPKWVRGGGKVLPGLVKRRLLEAGLFKGKAA